MKLRRVLDDTAAASPGFLAVLFGALVAANALAWLMAWIAFAARPALLGTALLAWVFGLRHAVDADHIAAIDNVVRKLMHAGKRPLLAGGFFSLGHSTVVILAAAVFAATAAALQGRFAGIRMVGGVIGTFVSALFLLLLAALNVAVLLGVWRRFRAAARGAAVDAAGLDVLLNGRGLMVRLLRPVFRVVSRSWHMFLIGLLFGLGFDTATEIGLLGISAAEAARGLSAWQTMVFPALFTAGMALVDSADSVVMVGAYGWAADQPLRKLWYDLTITAASVLIALLIGGVEVLGVLAERFGLHGGVWSVVASLADDGTSFGLAIIGVLLTIWLLSAGLYRWRAPAMLRAAQR